MTRTVETLVEAAITIDESKFTPEFMQEFREHFYDLDTIDEHIEHLGQMAARGLIHHFTTFIEGYGKTADMGIMIGEVNPVSSEVAA